MITYKPERNDLSQIWLRVFEVLSLKSMHSFLKDMGCILEVTNSLQTIATNYVCSYFKPKQDHLVVWQETIKNIEHEDGLVVASTLIEWVESMFSKSEGNHWYNSLEAWDTLLLNGISNPKTASYLVHLDFSDTKLSQLQMVVEEHRENLTSLRQRLKASNTDIQNEANIVWKGCYDYLDYIIDNKTIFILFQSRFILQKQLWENLTTSFSSDALEKLRMWGESIVIQGGLIDGDDHLYIPDFQLA